MSAALPPSLPPQLLELLSAVDGLLASKYFAAAGLVCSLWDSILTFSDEFEYIWRRGYWDVTRASFLLIRYSNLAAMLYICYVFAGFRGTLDDIQCVTCQTCRGFLVAMSTLAVISIGTANGFMTIRHYMLWDRKKAAMLVLCCAFAASYLTVFVFFIFTVKSFYQHAYYNPYVNVCLLTQKPLPIIGVWAAMTAFDVFAITMAALNALEQPYRQSVEIVSHFKRDGAFLFIALFLLRLINLVLSIVLRKEEIFLIAFFVWCMVSIVTCRLILRVAAIQAQTSKHVGTVRVIDPTSTIEMTRWRAFSDGLSPL